MQNTKITWPTREEWAEQQRALYYDRFDCLDLDERLSVYASESEIETIIGALQSLWKAEGVHLRALNVPKELERQRGESLSAHLQRHETAMTPVEQELFSSARELKFQRSAINEAIRHLRADEMPAFYSCDTAKVLKIPSIATLFDPVLVRYEAAKEAAEEKRRQEILATPIDDAAWERELQRRANLERNHPGWFNQ